MVRFKLHLHSPSAFNVKGIESQRAIGQLIRDCFVERRGSCSARDEACPSDFGDPLIFPSPDDTPHYQLTESRARISDIKSFSEFLVVFKKIARRN